MVKPARQSDHVTRVRNAGIAGSSFLAVSQCQNFHLFSFSRLLKSTKLSPIRLGRKWPEIPRQEISPGKARKRTAIRADEPGSGNALTARPRENQPAAPGRNRAARQDVLRQMQPSEKQLGLSGNVVVLVSLIRCSRNRFFRFFWFYPRGITQERCELLRQLWAKSGNGLILHFY